MLTKEEFIKLVTSKIKKGPIRNYNIIKITNDDGIEYKGSSIVNPAIKIEELWTIYKTLHTKFHLTVTTKELREMFPEIFGNTEAHCNPIFWMALMKECEMCDDIKYARTKKRGKPPLEISLKK